jgi:CBS domain-containing protein
LPALLLRRPLLIREATLDDHDVILKMYRDFEPKESYQGLPPANPARLADWVKSMMENGFNLVGISFDNQAVCHGSVFAIDESRSEFVLAVSPPYQSAGIGTQLTRLVKKTSHELGFERIWLCVESCNHKARHIYSKLGFLALFEELGGECEMCVELTLDPGMRDQVAAIMNRQVVSLTPDRKASEAIGLFLGDPELSGLPVIDARRELVGFVSETDVLESRARECRIFDIMTRNVTHVYQDSPVEDIVELICTKRIKQIPVVDRDRVLVGMVTRKDVIRHLFGTEKP